VEPLHALHSIGWLPVCAQAESARSYALTHRGLHGTAGTGTTCWNYVGLSKPVSSISTASTIPVGQMIDCYWA
jgi:hypothetical protein